MEEAWRAGTALVSAARVGLGIQEVGWMAVEWKVVVVLGGAGVAAVTAAAAVGAVATQVVATLEADAKAEEG